LDGLSAMGVGHERQRTRSRIPKTFRLGDCAQRPHPPGTSESRRQRDVPHRDVDRVPATRAWNRALAGPNESPSGKTAQHAWSNERSVRSWQVRSRRRRLQPQLRNPTNPCLHLLRHKSIRHYCSRAASYSWPTLLSVRTRKKPRPRAPGTIRL